MKLRELEMRRVGRGAVVALALFLPLAACGESGRSDSHAAKLIGAHSADQAWSNLLGGPKPSSLPRSANTLEAFLEDVEKGDQWRRETGLKFWKQYPHDERKYSWLLQTVMMPPHYARRVDEWAKNEAQYLLSGGRGLNLSDTNTDELTRWDRVYRVMESEFLNSPQTTQVQRRKLRSWAIYNAMRRHSESIARGESGDRRRILTSVKEFARDYPEPADEVDATSSYPGDIQRLYSMIFDFRARDYFKDAKDRRLFLLSLPPSKDKWVAAYIAKRIARSRSEDTLRNVLEGYEARYFTRRQADLSPFAEEIFGKLFEEEIAEEHLSAVQAMKHAKIGQRYWDSSHDNVARARWLASAFASSGVGIHTSNFYRRIISRAKNDRSVSYHDPKADDLWREFLESCYKELIVSGDLPLESRIQLSAARLRSNLDKLILQEHPDRAEAAWNIFNEYDRWLQRYARSGSRSVINVMNIALAQLASDYTSLGLSEHDVLEIAGRYEKSSYADLREQARGLINLIRAKGAPFELVARTLDGESFDVRSLRGKVVFVDHWSTGCSVCIEKMPEHHRIYQQYRGRGVEFVSVGYDANQHKNRVRRLIRELGLKWITLAGDDIRDEMFSKYGWAGYPQYTVLDRAGRLYASTDSVKSTDDLRRILEEMTSKP